VNYDDKAPWPTNADGRGMSLNRIKVEEYANDPTNWVALPRTPGGQYLQVEVVEFSASPWQVKLRFPGTAYSSYTIQYKSALGTGGWTRLVNLPAQSTSGLREAVDASPPAGTNRFYRVVCPQQP
jgi:hypothetical protein